MKTCERSFVISGARVLDPQQGLDELRDVLVSGEKIEAVDVPGAFKDTVDVDFIDASGLILSPGLVDLHVHLREPGFEWKETISSGMEAAAAGGFTEICCMPSTEPVNDRAEITKFINEQSQVGVGARVRPVGAITQGMKGEIISPMIELKEEGCVAFCDDANSVADALVMRKALEYSLMLDTVLAVHEEDHNLARNSMMNESVTSVKLGLVGMPEAAENVMIARDIELARLTGASVHFCHVSTARGVTLIKRAKEDGVPVTAEVAPHHFTLDDSMLESYDTMLKMKMPLRSEENKAALLEGLKEGVIDCIASDHAPHEMDSKRCEFENAAFGIIGLQTTLPLTLAKVKEGKLSLNRAIEALSVNPRKCFKLAPVSIAAGQVADMTLIDLTGSFTLSDESNKSKSKNSPFWGLDFQGKAVSTFVAGKRVFEANN